MKPLPSKPADLMPSADSLAPPQPQNPQPSGGADSGAPPLQPPAAPQAAGQITITYPDGRKEVIDVVDVQRVRQVAKAEQVIQHPASLSASFPQTSYLQQVSTSSLPAVLMPGRGSADDAAKTSNTAKSQSVGGTPQQVGGGDQSASMSQVASGLKSADDSAPTKKKKKAKGNYQSHSAPTIAEP